MMPDVFIIDCEGVTLPRRRWVAIVLELSPNCGSDVTICGERLCLEASS